MLRRFRPHVFAILAAFFVTCAGCGGDAYEQQFDKSWKHLKSTGQPIPRAGLAPAQDAAAQNDQPAAK
jgi:hypothetical protein